MSPSETPGASECPSCWHVILHAAIVKVSHGIFVFLHVSRGREIELPTNGCPRFSRAEKQESRDRADDGCEYQFHRLTVSFARPDIIRLEPILAVRAEHCGRLLRVLILVIPPGGTTRRRLTNGGSHIS